MRLSVSGARQPQGQPELHGQVEVDVEELRLDLHGAHVGVEVAHVEAPQDGPLDLGPALAAHLVEIGVVPDVLDGAGEAAVAVEQRGGVGDGAPPVEVVLGVDGEVHADVVAPVAGRRAPGPRAGDHQAGARGQAVAQGLVDPDVGGVAEAEVVAVEDQELGVVGVAEALGEGWHAPDGSALVAPAGPVAAGDAGCSGGVGPGVVQGGRRARAARAAASPRRPTRRVGSSMRQSLSAAGRAGRRASRQPGEAAVGTPRGHRIAPRCNSRRTGDQRSLLERALARELAGREPTLRLRPSKGRGRIERRVIVGRSSGAELWDGASVAWWLCWRAG